MTQTSFPSGLYGITPDWDETKQLLDAIKQAHQGGMSALQWRRKHGTHDQLIRQAEAIRELCFKLGLVFIVNDAVQIAHQLDADGVHIGKDDGTVAAARSILGPDKIIGTSCYNQPVLASQAITAGANYVAFGAVYPSSTKPGAPRATTAHIRQASQIVQQHQPNTAIVAIGGITPDNAAPIIAAGANSLAVINSLFTAPDIYLTAKSYTELFHQ